MVWPTYGEREIALKTDYDTQLITKFESYKVNIPENYDDHLTRIYGEYMKLPPKSMQISHHEYSAYRKEE